MVRYALETRRQVLEMYRSAGLTKTCKHFHLPSSTIYRWLSQEKRNALFSMVSDERCDEKPTEIEEDVRTNEPAEESIESDEKQVDDTQKTLNQEETRSAVSLSEMISLPSQEENPNENVPDMITLLIAENEKLQERNLQLRKALQAFVM